MSSEVRRREHVNDVIEYWFGAAILNEDAGTDTHGNLFDVNGVDNPFTGQSWSFTSGQRAHNQDHSASFLTASGLLPVADFPQFASWAAGKYVRPGGPFDPHTGANYVYSQVADVSYKRNIGWRRPTGMPRASASFVRQS